MPKEQHYKRRNYFVKKEYQVRFILKFCLILALGAVLSSALLIYFSQGTLTSTYSNSRLTVETTAWAILPAVLITNVTTLILISLAAVGVILFISHKIAGPLFRFEKELKTIGSGDLTRRISLRKKDQLMDMAESLNHATANLRQRLLEIQKALEDCSQNIGSHKSNAETAAEIQKIIEMLASGFKL